MAIDTHGLSAQHEGKRLRMRFADGEVSEIKLLNLEVHENCEFCIGYALFLYDIISTNRTDRYKKLSGSCVYSAELKDVESFEVLGD
jgi:hypothetical protein